VLFSSIHLESVGGKHCCRHRLTFDTYRGREGGREMFTKEELVRFGNIAWPVFEERNALV